MKIDIFENDLKLKYPFGISRHTYFSQQNVIIELRHDGVSGYGEATVNPYYQITIENLTSAFKSIEKKLRDYDFTTPDQLFNDFSFLLNTNSFSLGALNNASWDLYGKILDKPVKQLIDLPQNNSVLTSYTLGIDEKEKMLDKMNDCPWPIYKIKLGTKSDIELIQYLRNQTKSTFRVDANCAWNADEAIEKSEILKDLGIEFIEQPLSKDDPGQKRCFDKCSLPLMADESCCQESDVEKCIGNFHGINIKLLKCGGLSPAIRMVKKARKYRLKLMVGCMTETSVGISAAAQLLPFVDYADLDGPLLLAEDLAEGVSYEAGKIHITNDSGLGIKFIGKKY
jgi:L-alanine-DL-glutamate epimerase-like enolase superfamily enzyme